MVDSERVFFEKLERQETLNFSKIRRKRQVENAYLDIFFLERSERDRGERGKRSRYFLTRHSLSLELTAGQLASYFLAKSARDQVSTNSSIENEP